MFSMRQKRLGVSIRGGGASGAAYIGFWKALTDSEIEIHSLIGASAGAIISSAIAFGKTPQDMIAILDSFSFTKLISLKGLSELSLLDITKTKETLLNIFGNVNIEDSKVPLFIQVVNTTKGRQEILSRGNLADALIMSAAHPLLLKPIELNGDKYVDGAVLNSFGAETLRGAGAEVVIGTFLSRFENKEFNSRDLLSLFDLVEHELLRRDLVISPVDLVINDLGDVGLTDFLKGKELIDSAYKKTMTRMPEIQELVHKRRFLFWG